MGEGDGVDLHVPRFEMPEPSGFRAYIALFAAYGSVTRVAGAFFCRSR